MERNKRFRRAFSNEYAIQSDILDANNSTAFAVNYVDMKKTANIVVNDNIDIDMKKSARINVDNNVDSKKFEIKPIKQNSNKVVDKNAISKSDNGVNKLISFIANCIKTICVKTGCQVKNIACFTTNNINTVCALTGCGINQIGSVFANNPNTAGAISGLLTMFIADQNSQLEHFGEDGYQQIFTQKQNDNLQHDYFTIFDMKLSLQSACQSAAITPIFVKYLGLLDKALPGSMPFKILLKIILSTLTSLAINNPCFTYYIQHLKNSLDKKDVDLNSIRLDTFEHLKKDSPLIIKDGAKVWIPIQAVGQIVPEHLKVMQQTSCTAGFGAYMNHKSIGSVKPYLTPLFDLEKYCEIKDLEKNYKEKMNQELEQQYKKKLSTKLQDYIKKLVDFKKKEEIIKRKEYEQELEKYKQLIEVEKANEMKFYGIFKPFQSRLKPKD